MITDEQLAALEAIARAVPFLEFSSDAHEKFLSSVSPDVVLALIAEVRRLREPECWSCGDSKPVGPTFCKDCSP